MIAGLNGTTAAESEKLASCPRESSKLAGKAAMRRMSAFPPALVTVRPPGQRLRGHGGWYRMPKEWIVTEMPGGSIAPGVRARHNR